MSRLPSLGAVEAFAAVARTGSAKRAAESLSLSPSALSRRIQGLEAYLGVDLFERRHQSLLLTPQGVALADALTPVLDDLRRVFEMYGSVGELRLHLGVMPLFASHILMPQLPRLREAHPTLHLELDTAPTPIARLGDGLDAAIWLVDNVDPRFYARQIGSERIVAVTSRAAMEAGTAPQRPTDLSSHTILMHRDMPHVLQSWQNGYGLPSFRPADVILFDSGQLILDAAASGLGIGLLLDSLITDDHRLAKLFGDGVDSPYNYYFICRRPALADRAVRTFHDWLFSNPLR